MRLYGVDRHMPVADGSWSQPVYTLERLTISATNGADASATADEYQLQSKQSLWGAKPPWRAERAA